MHVNVFVQYPPDKKPHVDGHKTCLSCLPLYGTSVDSLIEINSQFFLKHYLLLYDAWMLKSNCQDLFHSSVTYKLYTLNVSVHEIAHA